MSPALFQCFRMAKATVSVMSGLITWAFALFSADSCLYPCIGSGVAELVLPCLLKNTGVFADHGTQFSITRFKSARADQ